MQAYFRSSRFLLIFIPIWLFLCATIRFLSIPDEGRYADISRLMYESGDWMVPRLNDLPFIHKPPLLHWLTSIFLECFGLHIWTVRLVPVLAATFMLIATYLFVKLYLSERIAQLSILILATNLLFFGSSQYVNHDLLLAAGITLCLFCLVNFTLSGKKSMLFAGYAFASAAFLTKGLIGILIPGMVLLPWLIFSRQFRKIPGFFHPVAILILLGLIGPWLYMMQHHYPAFLNYFFIEQQFDRFHSNQFNNKHPWFYYLLILLASVLPWLTVPHQTDFQQAFKQNIPSVIKSFLVWWLISVTLFFSIPPSKLPGYILPAIVPMTILLAVWIDQTVQNTVQLSKLQQYAIAIFVMFMGGILALSPYWITLNFILTTSQKYQIILISGLLLIVPVVLLSLLKYKKINYLKYITFNMMLLCTTVPFTARIFDIKNNHDQISFAQYIQPSSKIVFYQNYFYDIPFLLDLKKPVYIVDDWNKALADNSSLELHDGLKFEPQRQPLLWNQQQLRDALAKHENLIVLSKDQPIAFGGYSANKVIRYRNFNVYIFN